MTELKVKEYKRGKLTVWANSSENADIDIVVCGIIKDAVYNKGENYE